MYFPLLVPLSFLSKEQDHVQGFAKECAGVCVCVCGREKDGYVYIRACACCLCGRRKVLMLVCWSMMLLLGSTVF